MRLKPVILVLAVIQVVIQPCLALNQGQIDAINLLSNATGVNNLTLIDLFSSLNSTMVFNYTMNATCDISNAVNRTELVDYYYTANDTRAMVDALEESIDDRFMRIPEYYVRSEGFNETVEGIKSQMHNETMMLNDNMVNLAKNNDTRFNIAYFLIALSLVGTAYMFYNYKKKVINVSEDIKSVLPDVTYESKSIDELDSSKGFIDRIRGITAIKAKVGSLKLPDSMKQKLIDRANQGVMASEADLKNEIEAMRAERHEADRNKAVARHSKKGR